MHSRADRREPEGKRTVGFTDGARESAQDWRELLLDLKNRGLAIAPKLAIADGARAFAHGKSPGRSLLRVLRPSSQAGRA